MRILCFAAAFAAAPLVASDLDLVSALERARPSPGELAVATELASARRQLARSAGILLDGPVLTAEGGPRRGPEGDDSDLAIGLELPLAGDSSARRAALDAWRRAARDLPAAAEIERRLAIELAFVAAWEADRSLALAQRERAALERWLEVVVARVEEGAAAPFESVLVAAELDAARLEAAEARSRARSAWAGLDALADVGPSPTALVQPAAPSPGERDGVGAAPLVARAVESRGALELAQMALEAERDGSRWSIGGALEREGDEDVARLGVGYRIPLRRESAAIRALRTEREEEIARLVELAKAELGVRLGAALERFTALTATAPAASEAELALAATALEARVAAGKDRPSEALLLRRELVRAHATLLSARATRLRAAFEIRALTAETLP